jgi:hypothetical protein
VGARRSKRAKVIGDEAERHALDFIIGLTGATNPRHVAAGGKV